MVDEHLKEWNGIPIKNYDPAESVSSDSIYRLVVDWDDSISFNEKLEKFLADPESSNVVGLSLGGNGDSAMEYYTDIVKPFLQHASHFPKLRFLFVGEMDQEESELTWIGMNDCGAPVLNIFPALEDLRIRGGLDYAEGENDALLFSSARHICLKTLVIETAGLPKASLQGIRESVLPELERLEIWLGSDERGGNCTIDDLKPLVLDNPFPKLKALALKNSEIINDVAKLLATAPILSQLEELDLSLGTLTDEGALALLESEGVEGLKKLNLSYHFMSNEVMERFSSLGIAVDVSNQEEPDNWDGEDHYYVAVSE